ncbi:MAG TPA: ATP-binding protein [Stellaceae bacterium]|nr:ATP-binding protein [Stellaceae bacterium]
MIEQPGTAAQEAIDPSLRRRSVMVVLGIAFVSVVTPALLAYVLWGEHLAAAFPLGGGLPLLVSYVLGAVACGVVALWRGLDRLAQDLSSRDDTEHEQILIRIVFPSIVFDYSLAALAFSNGDPGDAAAALTMGIGMVLAWLFLLHLLLFSTERAPWRRRLAMVADLGVLSVYLHFGGATAAAWYGIYIWLGIGYGLRYGLKPLFQATIVGVVGFAAVIATTPFWYQHLPLSGGLVFALMVLPAYLTTLIRNLTEAKAQADEANAAKSRFLAIMSHELRTPLSAMIGMDAILRRTRLDARQRDMLATMNSSARALLALINDILDISKIEAGKFAPAVEAFDLHAVLNGTLAMLRPQALAKDLSLDCRVDPRIPYALRGWPHQLRQIITNLVANAIKFTDKGRISVIFEAIAVDERKAEMRLSVRDEGIGVPPEAQEKIFDLFTQADGAVTRRYGGTGLGLAIVKQLVELMGGTVTLTSQPGKGSVFTVDLGFAREPENATEAIDLKNQLVLVVTEDAELSGWLHERIAQWHGTLRGFKDTAAAAQFLTTRPPDAGRVVLFVDGRNDPVDALSVPARVAGAAQEPLTLLLADGGHLASIANLAGARVSALLADPIDELQLARSLHSLPAPESDAPAIEGEEQNQSSEISVARKPLKVLLAEDNAPNRMIIQRILELAGHSVVTAADGEEALQLMEQPGIDLVLMDINMPELSGYEAAKLFRMANLDQPRLPILALTADATSQTERLCREAGMDGVLTKPIEAAHLLATIDEIGERGIGTLGAATPLPASVVTPIAQHPRYGSDGGAVLDDAAVEALRALGAGSEFFNDVVENFRSDVRGILDDMARAAAQRDLRAFRDHAHSLRSSAAHIGAIRFYRALFALREITAQQLDSEGTQLLDRLRGEYVKLDAALRQKIQEVKRG